MNFDYKILKNKKYKSIKKDDADLSYYQYETFNIDDTEIENTDKIPVFPDLNYLKDDSRKVDENVFDNEIRNSKILYEAINEDMNWIKASNSNLWTYLCHTKYFNYVKERHENGNKEKLNKRFSNFSNADDKEKKSLRRLVSRRFCTNNDNGYSLTWNHIGRLWLVPELTYKCWERFEGLEALKHDDPYHYTELAFKHQGLLFDWYQRPGAISFRSFGVALIIYLSKNERRKVDFRRPFLKAVYCNLAVNPVYLDFNLDRTFEYFDDITKKLSF